MTGPVLALLPVLLALGGLWMGTGLALRGATRLSRRARWEGWFGVSVLAVAPVLPEIGIAVGVGVAAAAGASTGGLLVGTVLGSVLARGTLVLGAGTLLGAGARTHVPPGRLPAFLLASLALVAGLGFDGRLTARDGGVLLAAWLVHHVARVHGAARRRDVANPEYGLLPDPFLVGLGVLAVVAAGWWAVGRTELLSGAWGVDPVLVGLLVLGLGASLPELSLALSAATEGRAGLSPASVLASSVQGLLLPLGIAALLAPVPIGALTLALDLPAVALLIAGLWAWDRRPPVLSARRSVGLLVGYLTYALVRMIVS